MSAGSRLVTTPYKVNMRLKSQVLAAGESFDIYESFNYIVVESGDNVQMSINGQPPAIDVPRGTGFRIPDYQLIERVRITNNGVVTQLVSVFYAIGEVVDHRISGTVSIITPVGTGIQIASPVASVSTQVAVSNVAVLLKAANVKRASLSINANDTKDLFIGAIGVTAGTGYRVPAGATYVLQSTDAIYGIHAVVGAVNNFVREETYP